MTSPPLIDLDINGWLEAADGIDGTVGALDIHQLDLTQIQSLLFAVLSKHAKEFSLFHAKAYLQQAANSLNRATLLQLKKGRNVDRDRRRFRA